jgi:phosphoribosylformimino-5-aminoimidazole carboxamide ribotide isomerase
VIIPCIDLMGGKVVQLVQGREKALEGDEPLVMIEKFSDFPVIQVIDLDAAMDQGSNDAMVRELASRAQTHVGGGVRTAERARRLVEAGASKVIVGTAAFGSGGINRPLLEQLVGAVGVESLIVALDSKDGRIVVKGWRQSTNLSAEEVMHRLGPYCGGFLCTYVDKEGMLDGTDLDWFVAYARLPTTRSPLPAESPRWKKSRSLPASIFTQRLAWPSTPAGSIWPHWRGSRGIWAARHPSDER